VKATQLLALNFTSRDIPRFPILRSLNGAYKVDARCGSGLYADGARSPPESSLELGC
jgi:hypothetical protein